jgi:Icc-related predicted phosphoesterase
MASKEIAAVKVWVMSDLHLEVAPLDRPLEVPEADLCIVAGDLCRGVANGVSFLARLLESRMPCLYVAGNHEYWGSGIGEEIAAGKAAAACHPGIHFLENTAVTIGGIRFFGATLWTDFSLRGHRAIAMRHARERMRDYRRISLSKNPWQRFVPEASAHIHARSRSFIGAVGNFPGKSVVVTHHAPHPRSLAIDPSDPLIDAAYASNLEALLFAVRPALWIHGHTHLSRDYMVGETRVISNPCGYPDERARFDRNYTIEI